MHPAQAIIASTYLAPQTGNLDIPPAISGTHQSLYFNGASSHFFFPASDDLIIGNADFMTEVSVWAHHSSFAAPRVFSLGEYPGAALGISIEGAQTLYYWADSQIAGSTVFDEPKFNSWQHIVFSRKNGVGYLYLNGQIVAGPIANLGSISDNVSNLTFGSETPVPNDTFYKGFITRFHLRIGSSPYDDTNLPPSSVAPIEPHADSVIVMNMATAEDLYLNEVVGGIQPEPAIDIIFRGSNPY